MNDRIFSKFFVPELGRARAIAHRYANVAGIWLVTLAVFAAQGCNRSHEEVQAQRMVARVKEEFLHAWRNYERYAWGHDALRPLSKTPHDWYGQSLLMTPVDALDTLILMNLDADVAKTKELIVRDLSFDRDIYVKNFEITIRLLGGLLSGYQLTNDQRLLKLAEDLGNRLLPAFNSPTGLPYVYVNLRTGQVRDPVTKQIKTVGRIGAVGADVTVRVPMSPLQSVRVAGRQTWLTATKIVDVVRGLLTREVSVKQLGGPIAITRASVAAAQSGLESLFLLVALLSVNVAVLNLLPIPILDGGQILLNIAEAAKGSPFSARTREYILRFGLVAILLIFALSTFNDVRDFLARLFA